MDTLMMKYNFNVKNVIINVKLANIHHQIVYHVLIIWEKEHRIANAKLDILRINNKLVNVNYSSLFLVCDN